MKNALAAIAITMILLSIPQPLPYGKCRNPTLDCVGYVRFSKWFAICTKWQITCVYP